MRRYKPRRARADRVEGAPPYVLAVYDNGGQTLDRYTVLFGGDLWWPELGPKVQLLHMSATPFYPQGVSMWGEGPASPRSVYGKPIRWLDLPERVRDHVKMRAEE